MVLPDTLQQALDDLIEGFDLEELKEAAFSLTSHYKTIGFLKEKKERLAYLITRLPATYEAAHAVLEKVPFQIESFLDIGSGPGTAIFAAHEIWGESLKTTSVEKDTYFLELAAQLKLNSEILKKDVREIEEFDPHDVVYFGYSYGEFVDETVLAKSWRAAKKALILVEPGTPKGYAVLQKARDFLLNEGGYILAPCPHGKKCPLTPSDWCHFAARVERSFLHRRLKEGTLAYEDEKYSYLIVTKENKVENKGRILRDPLKKSGHVRLFLCAPEGCLEEEIVSKRDKERYKKARKIEWGDAF